MDGKSFDIFFSLWLCLLLSSDLPICTAHCESGEGKKCFAILGFFFFNRWILTILCLVTMFDFGEFVHLDTSVLRYCTYSSDDVLLLLMMMIHSLLDLIRRAGTL